MTGKIKIKVDIDWESTGIWVQRNSVWLNSNYSQHPIPSWLVSRFKYWCDWYNSHAIDDFEFEDDVWEKLESYKVSLAIDLRRVLKSNYEVFYWDSTKGKIINVPLMKLK